ncbi:helix-turn-helix transcriptional regulator [Streptomyces sp. NPDC049555]|uniref:helix-turn-helix domain-containing protein n=1 Tax=Streptomyces sp. NPDC049555 TaxID=3154930 RepID=UPI00341F74EF
MTSETSQPPMAWRLCGNQVKLWRTEAGISREQLAQEAGYGCETVSSMEQGRRRPTQRLLEVADDMCGARGKLRAALAYLEPERFAVRSREYLVLEAEAIALQWYEVLLIPGLLQTEGYARALMSSHCPPVDRDTVEARVTARLERHELLKKPTVLFNFVIHEAALRSMVGGAETMKAQLNHLLAAGELHNATVQVLTSGQGANPGLSGPFMVLETPDHKYYGFEEGQETGVLHADAERVSALMKRHAMIRMHALSEAESARFISKLAEDL